MYISGHSVPPPDPSAAPPNYSPMDQETPDPNPRNLSKLVSLIASSYYYMFLS